MKQKSFLKKLYEILTPRERHQAVLVFIASLGTAFAQAFGVASIFPFISVVMNPDIVWQNKWLSFLYQKGNFTDINSFIIFLGIGVFLMVISSSIISAITTWGKTRFTLGKNHALSLRLFTVYLSQPYEFFLQKHSSELGKNILSEIYQLTNQLLMGIFDILINGLMVIVIVGMLFMVNISVTVGTVIFLGGSYALLNSFVKNRLRKIGRERLEANKERFRTINESLSSIKITKVLGIEPFFLKNYSYFSGKFTRYNVLAHVIGEVPRYILEAFAFGGIVFFVIIMIARGEKVIDLIPLLSLYAFAAYRAMPALNRLYSAMTTVYYNTAIVDKIYEDMIEIGLYKSPESSRLPEQKESELLFEKEIKLEKIKFCYDKSTFDVINELNLTIPKNSIIGFVGATGCGKTTLVDIILGLLVPQFGQILVDDIPITERNIKAWQKKIGYVPQEIYLSDDSIRKNIAFGVPENEINEGQVRVVAKIAALDGFIEKELPENYNTIVGERGIRLSGGQRQRIGLARALYRNPEVLVLDEATSSLDGITEEAVLKAIKSAARSRTVLMIAHRLTTLKDCDLIYILDRGQIIEQGTYQELISQNKKFREMAKISEK
ncbi:MAG TPA: ABC transporter ATP-binding protein [Atribacterota bacterium]|nr:ABC transporter ATP-binding protein [Atribacterota bacterium]